MFKRAWRVLKEVNPDTIIMIVMIVWAICWVFWMEYKEKHKQVKQITADIYGKSFVSIK